LRQVVFQPRQFPILTLRDAEEDDAVAEVTAAVEAML
jgi:hypothetical protein